MKRRILLHTLFWIVIMIFLTIYFGRPWSEYLHAFYFVTFLLPIAMATSYFFNYYLVPGYLLQRKYLLFIVYLIYLVIISLYLEMMVMTLSLILFAQYKFEEMLPMTRDIFSMAITLYFVVFIVAFVRLIRSLQKLRFEKQLLTDRLDNNSQTSIIIRADRKNIPLKIVEIYYIESLADYVRIHTKQDEIISKEKISHLMARLPNNFVRTHRSFIINSSHVQRFSREIVQVKGQELPISRSYREAVFTTLS